MISVTNRPILEKSVPFESSIDCLRLLFHKNLCIFNDRTGRWADREKVIFRNCPEFLPDPGSQVRRIGAKLSTISSRKNAQNLRSIGLKLGALGRVLSQKVWFFRIKPGTIFEALFTPKNLNTTFSRILPRTGSGVETTENFIK